MGTYTFTWAHPSQQVYVTGTFDNWAKTIELEKKGDVFEKTVQLPRSAEKILYKFVADDEWKHDPTAKTETDHEGNVNNVLYPKDITGISSSGSLAIAPAAKEEKDGLSGGEAAGLVAGGGAGAVGLAASVLSSAAPSSTTAQLAGQQPIEPRKEATVADDYKLPSENASAIATAPISSVAPTSTTTELAGQQPLEEAKGPTVMDSEGAKEDVEEKKLQQVGQDGEYNDVDHRAAVGAGVGAGAGAAALGAAAISSAAPGSTTAELAGAVPKESDHITTTASADAPGAFPETPAAELEKPDPITSTASAAAPGAFPETPAAEEKPEQIASINPIPATSGIGNPTEAEKPIAADMTAVNATAHDDPELKAADEAKTKSEEQAFGVAPIPASSGIGNPIEADRPIAGDSAAINATAFDDPELKAADEAKTKAVDEEQAFGVAPIPATSGIGNPSEIEKPVIGDSAAINATAFDDPELKAADEAKTKEEEKIASVNPIPATSGIGNPPESERPIAGDSAAIGATAFDDPELKAADEAKTKAVGEEQAFGVAPIPATSGIGNPSESERAAPGDSAAINATAFDDPELKAADEAKTKSVEEEKIASVNPIPATSGLGNPPESERPVVGDAAAISATAYDDPELKAADKAASADKPPQLPVPDQGEPLSVPDPSETKAAQEPLSAASVPEPAGTAAAQEPVGIPRAAEPVGVSSSVPEPVDVSSSVPEPVDVSSSVPEPVAVPSVPEPVESKAVEEPSEPAAAATAPFESKVAEEPSELSEPAVTAAPFGTKVAEEPLEPVADAAPLESKVAEAPSEPAVVAAPLETKAATEPSEPAAVAAPFEAKAAEQPSQATSATAPLETKAAQEPVDAPVAETTPENVVGNAQLQAADANGPAVPVSTAAATSAPTMDENASKLTAPEDTEEVNSRDVSPMSKPPTRTVDQTAPVVTTGTTQTTVPARSGPQTPQKSAAPARSGSNQTTETPTSQTKKEKRRSFFGKLKDKLLK